MNKASQSPHSGPGPGGNLALLGLTMVSACLDAISYLGLGHVFPANMTGNTVLLGIGAATGDAGAASRSAAALGAFLLGAAAIGPAFPHRPSASGIRTILAVEVAVLGGLCAWWLASGVATPDGAMRYGLIGLAGAAMGAQSAFVRSLGVPVTTTYITGTWTGLSTGVAGLLRRSATERDTRARGLQALVVVVYLGAACGAAFAHIQFGAAAVVLPLGLLLLVTVAAATVPNALAFAAHQDVQREEHHEEQAPARGRRAADVRRRDGQGR